MIKIIKVIRKETFRAAKQTRYLKTKQNNNNKQNKTKQKPYF